MDLQKFDDLESKISQAISVIQKLKHENRELQTRVQALQKENQEKEAQLEAQREEMQRLKDHAHESQQFKAREEEIRSKVEKCSLSWKSCSCSINVNSVHDRIGNDCFQAKSLGTDGLEAFL
jgi:FtsZ-binding cell division protein ZapB